jgi:hypothetical protein
VPIEEWLRSIHVICAGYATGFYEYGYQDTSVLVGVKEEEMRGAFEEIAQLGGVKVKPAFQTKIIRALGNLQQ